MIIFAAKLVFIHGIVPALLVVGFERLRRRLVRGDITARDDQYLLGTILLQFVFYGIFLTALLYLLLNVTWWTGWHSMVFGAALIITPMVSLVLAVLAWPGRMQSLVHGATFYASLLYPAVLFGTWFLAGLWLGVV